MGVFAALDVLQDEAAIFVVGQDRGLLAEAKVPTGPEAIADWICDRADGLERVGMETGSLALELPDGAAAADHLHRCTPCQWRAEDDAQQDRSA